MGAIKGHSNKIRIGLDTVGNTSIWAGPDPLINTLTFDTSVDMEKIYVVGDRDAVDIVEGVQEVTGSLERNLYSDNASNEIVDGGNSTHYDLLEATGLYGDNLSQVKILFNTTSRTAGSPNRVIHGAKLHSYSTNHAATDIVTESAEYDGLNISTS